MTRFVEASKLRSIALGAWLAVGCGGSANLGDDYPDGPLDRFQGDPNDESSQPDREFVQRFPAQFSLMSLAVSGAYLYVPVPVPHEFENATGMVVEGTMGRLLRCEKRDCVDTVQVIHQDESSYFDSLSVFGERIGMLQLTWPSEPRAALLSCRLPECDDLARFDGLRTGVAGLSFGVDEVQWSQREDDATYRCTLPTCKTPELLLSGVAANEAFRSGDVAFLREEGQVWRRTTDSGALEALELGPELRAISGTEPGQSHTPHEQGVWTIAVDGDWLYATVDDGCASEMRQCSVARWPARGYGPRELIFEDDKPIEWMAVFDGELVVRSSRVQIEGEAPRWLRSCRVEACNQSFREFPVQGWAGVSVADDERLYWVEHFSGEPGTTQVRSAPRLARP